MNCFKSAIFFVGSSVTRVNSLSDGSFLRRCVASCVHIAHKRA